MPGIVTTPFAICIAIAAVAAITFIVLREVRGGYYSLVSKTLASLMFVISGVVFASVLSSWGISYVLAIVLGLTFGMIGDVLLDLKRNITQMEDIFLNAGMLSFGVGHIMYFLAAYFYVTVKLGVSFLVPALVGLVAIPIAFAIVLGSKILGLNLGKHKYQSLAYLAVLIYMTVMTITLACMYNTADNYLWLFALGMSLFLASDLVLSFTYFGDKSKKNFIVAMSVINHILYYAAQLAICSMIVFVS